MKTVLITGASGSVGQSFIKMYYDRYHFVSLSKNQEKQTALKNQFNKIDTVIESIENKDNLLNHFLRIKPDIVIHAAAQKRIEVGEKQPAEVIKTNIIGSLNIIESVKIAHVPITIGISSDKACLSNSVYGHTKNLMERVFLEAHDRKNKFSCCRLGNVAGSQGSVLPLWLKLARENKALKVTSKQMNRFMFMPNDVAELIQRAISNLEKETQPFVVTKNKKAVNMLDMALSISSNTEIIGKRPGERLNENLISPLELPFTYLEDDYIFIKGEKNSLKENRLKKPLNTSNAEKLNSDEIKILIKNVERFYEENLN